MGISVTSLRGLDAGVNWSNGVKSVSDKNVVWHTKHFECHVCRIDMNKNIDEYH